MVLKSVLVDVIEFLFVSINVLLAVISSVFFMMSAVIIPTFVSNSVFVTASTGALFPLSGLTTGGAGAVGGV
jgi:hypothetical protein